MDIPMTNTAVITFGRFNPITVGHEKLVNKVKALAAELNADPLVFLSHSHDNTKNPLDYASKYFYARKAFGDCIQLSNARTFIKVLQKVNEQYDNIIVIVGSDRVGDFSTLCDRYNGYEYHFKNIDVTSAGQRDPDSDGVDGMSASKLRSYAINNDVDSFENGLPITLKEHSKTILNIVRKGLNYED